MHRLRLSILAVATILAWSAATNLVPNSWSNLVASAQSTWEGSVPHPNPAHKAEVTNTQTVYGGSPILIPLGASPEVKVSSLIDGVVFDIDGDGNAEHVSWPEGDAGFLAIDPNGNGVIDSGLELFGDAGGHNDGFNKLLSLVGNLSGKTFDGPEGSHGLDASFPIFAKLLVWHDANRDGYSQPEELRPASELLTKISLNYKIVGKKDQHGNTFKYQGWIEVPQGGRRPIYDVFFVTR